MGLRSVECVMKVVVRAVVLLAFGVVAACSTEQPTSESARGAQNSVAAPAASGCARWLRDDSSARPVNADPRASMNELFARVAEFLKTGPVPLTEMGATSVGVEVIIELNSETHACELADELAQRFPNDAVYVKVWPPASLANEGRDFFGTWFLADAAVSHDDRLRLELSADGSFLMRDHCNYKAGRWAIENNVAKTVVFRDAAVTAIACPSRPDTLEPPRRAQINAAGELVVEQVNGRPLTYTR